MLAQRPFSDLLPPTALQKLRLTRRLDVIGVRKVHV